MADRDWMTMEEIDRRSERTMTKANLFVALGLGLLNSFMAAWTLFGDDPFGWLTWLQVLFAVVMYTVAGIHWRRRNGDQS